VDVDSSEPENVDSNGLDTMEGVVIEAVKMDSAGNLVVDYRAEGVLDSFCLPSNGITPSTIRRFRRWKRKRTILSLEHDKDSGYFQVGGDVPDDDRTSEALDTIQVIYIALQDVRSGLEILAGITQQAVLKDPLRGVINRYLR
jgi:hypothetical protein